MNDMNEATKCPVCGLDRVRLIEMLAEPVQSENHDLAIALTANCKSDAEFVRTHCKPGFMDLLRVLRGTA